MLGERWLPQTPAARGAAPGRGKVGCNRGGDSYLSAIRNREKICPTINI